MELIKYKNKQGILMLKPKHKNTLFEHCAGGKNWPNKKFDEIDSLLFMHGVHYLSVETAKSALPKKRKKKKIHKTPPKKGIIR